MQTEYVTAAFLGDLPLLRLQARSMRLHLDRASTAQIHVVNNDADVAAFAAAFAAEVLPEYGELAPRVMLHDAADFAGLNPAASGWRRQQALKLAIHRLVKAPFYVTLDAKNHLVRGVDAATFLTPDGRLVCGERRIKPEFAAVLVAFGLPPDRLPAFVFDIVTPFPLWTGLVREMEAHVLQTRGCNLAALLSNDGSLYEYLAYFAYLELSGGRSAQFHDRTAPRLSHGYWAKADDPPASSFAAVFRKPSLRFIAIHRNVFASPLETREVIAALWTSLGLVRDVAEGLTFLEAPARRWTPSAAAATTPTTAPPPR